MKFAYKLPILLCLFVVSGYQSFGQYFSQRSIDRAAYLNLMAYLKTKREGGNLKKWWKGEGTIGVALLGAATYHERSKYDAIPQVSSPSYDTIITGTAKPQLSIHLNTNSNHLITRLGTSSILSISVGEQVDILRWQFEKFSGNTRKTDNQSLMYVQFGAPVTLDYKWGCDVDFDPEIKTCFAIGAGAMPAVGGSFSGFDNAGLEFHVSPYVYASFGFFAHGCWKVRLSYIPGKYTIFNNATENYGGTINTLNISGNHIIGIGICHMSHSNDWGKGNAWRGRNHEGGGGRHHVSESSRMF